jgi:hypothetical protein
MKRNEIRTRAGRYTYSKFEAICARCGSKLGAHDAEAPHPNDDLSRGPECAGFKPGKK